MNRKKCKHCREYFRPEKRLQHYCLKAECVEAWVISLREAQWKKRKKQIKEELKTVQDLMKEAQVAFNAYIRERDKGKPCISCGKPLKGKYDAGHFFSSGGHKSVTFNEYNVHGQCVACNQHKHGNLLKYREGILKRIGERKLDELTQLSNNTIKFTRDDLKAIRDDYKEKLKELRRN